MQTMRLFRDVAHYRSFSRAAAEHSITQSAVSQRIAQLEKRLGVQLVDRSSRPLTLTGAGRLYLRGCEDLLRRFDRLEREVQSEARRGLHGTVRVEAIYSVGIELLNHVCENFAREHPRVEVEVDFKRPEQIHQLVRSGECDLGLVSFPRRWRGVEVVQLRTETMAVVCAANHELANRKKIHASELAPVPLATFESSLPVGARIRQYLRDEGVEPNIVNVFDNVETIKHVVSVTREVAILPRRVVQREVAAGTLACLELSPQLTRPIGIIHRRGGQNGSSLPDHVSAFVAALLAHAGPAADTLTPSETSSTQLEKGYV